MAVPTNSATTLPGPVFGVVVGAGVLVLVEDWLLLELDELLVLGVGAEGVLEV